MEHWPYPIKDFAVVAAGFFFYAGVGKGLVRQGYLPLGSSGSPGTDYVD